MSRKFKIALVISTVVALMVVGVAAAQGGPDGAGGPGRKGQGGAVGQVVAIDGDQITVEKMDGTQVVIQVNADTRYFSKDSDDDLSLADIEVGMWIGGRAEADADGILIANSIVILPEDFDPDAVRDDRGKRGTGTVVSVVGDSIMIENPTGEILTFVATDETKFISSDDSLQSLIDLQSGDSVGFGYIETDDGALELLAIGESRPAGSRGVGTVVSVSGDIVTVETADGETLTLNATADTRFGGKNGGMESLSDLQSGDSVGFGYIETDDGALELLAIGESRPAGSRGAGTVLSISGDVVTVETLDGEMLTLTATADTRFGDRDGSIESLSDLEVGDRVGFAYSEADDGTLELLTLGVGGGGKGKGAPGGGKGG